MREGQARLRRFRSERRRSALWGGGGCRLRFVLHEFGNKDDRQSHNHGGPDQALS